VDEDLLGGGAWGVFVGSFDEFVVGEAGADADEGDEVGCVHSAPDLFWIAVCTGKSVHVDTFCPGDRDTDPGHGWSTP
jgi:hypothetical protein